MLHIFVCLPTKKAIKRELQNHFKVIQVPGLMRLFQPFDQMGFKGISLALVDSIALLFFFGLFACAKLLLVDGAHHRSSPEAWSEGRWTRVEIGNRRSTSRAAARSAGVFS